MRIVVDSLPALRREVVREFEACAEESIAGRGRFVVAVPGGSVASAFFPALAQSQVDWARSDVFWTDERAVAPGDAESNYALALALLLGPAGVPANQVHRMFGEHPDPSTLLGPGLDAAAAKAESQLVAIAGDPPRLDLVLLGVGEDGHVASIFRGRPQGDESQPPVIAVYHSPKPPPRRLTLTMEVLARADRVMIVAFGEKKAIAVQQAFSDAEKTTPLAELLCRAKSPLLLLDPDAAKMK